MYAGVGFPVFRLQRRSSTPPSRGQLPMAEGVETHSGVGTKTPTRSTVIESLSMAGTEIRAGY